jgi:aconitate hydratase
MGVLPLEFIANQNADSLGIKGFESFTLKEIKSGDKTTDMIMMTNGKDSTTFQVTIRIDTPKEWEYFQNGGILQYVIRRLIAN